MNIPDAGEIHPKRGNWVTKQLSRFLFRTSGWQYEGSWPDLPRFVVVGAPHTSSWDFILTMAVMYNTGVRMSWLAKHTLIEGPFSWFFRWLGGIPVDRTAPQGLVSQIVAEFQQRDKLILALSPEGTRSRVREWKTGFYYIALGAKVPILPVVADYGRKVVRLADPIWPSGDLESDMESIKAEYAGVRGKNPRNF